MSRAWPSRASAWFRNCRERGIANGWEFPGSEPHSRVDCQGSTLTEARGSQLPTRCAARIQASNWTFSSFDNSLNTFAVFPSNSPISSRNRHKKAVSLDSQAGHERAYGDVAVEHRLTQSLLGVHEIRSVFCRSRGELRPANLDSIQRSICLREGQYVHFLKHLFFPLFLG